LERTNEGRARALREALGRKPKLNPHQLLRARH
jgi:hypothetical protein